MCEVGDWVKDCSGCFRGLKGWACGAGAGVWLGLAHNMYQFVAESAEGVLDQSSSSAGVHEGSTNSQPVVAPLAPSCLSRSNSQCVSQSALTSAVRSLSQEVETSQTGEVCPGTAATATTSHQRKLKRQCTFQGGRLVSSHVLIKKIYIRLVYRQ